MHKINYLCTRLTHRLSTFHTITNTHTHHIYNMVMVNVQFDTPNRSKDHLWLKSTSQQFFYEQKFSNFVSVFSFQPKYSMPLVTLLRKAAGLFPSNHIFLFSIIMRSVDFELNRKRSGQMAGPFKMELLIYFLSFFETYRSFCFEIKCLKKGQKYFYLYFFLYNYICPRSLLMSLIYAPTSRWLLVFALTYL